MCQIVLLGYSRATCARARCRYTLRAPDLEGVLVVRLPQYRRRMGEKRVGGDGRGWVRFSSWCINHIGV